MSNDKMVINRDRTARLELDKTLQLKLLVRDQKKEMSAIKDTSLFKEIMRMPAVPVVDQPRTRWDVKRPEGGGNTESEGKMQMLSGIRAAAIKGGKEESGVWSSFGKAYVSLGQFEDLKPSLPRLWRDEMAAEKESLKAQQMRPRHGHHVNPQRHALREEASSSTIESPQQEDEERLWKNLMMVTTRDFKEASFPKSPLKLADARRRMHSSNATRFVSPLEAAVQTSDPKQWGSWCYERPAGGSTLLSPLAHELSPYAPPITASTAHTRPSNMGSDSLGDGGEGPRMARELRLPTPPSWDPPMVKFLRPPAKEETRVEDWRASFIEARQQMRSKLQEDLWRRAQARGMARQSQPMAAGFASYLISDLDASSGVRESYHRPGTVPADIWQHAKYFMEHGARKGQSRKRPTAGPVDMEEIELLERFYNQLCLLVERQRVSDPCSVALLLCVKELLEKGLTLSRHLMAAVVEGLAYWANNSGMQQYNLCVLPILTFIRKCVGVDVEDMQKLVFNYHLGTLVYGEQAEAIKAGIKPTQPSGALRKGGRRSSVAPDRVPPSRPLRGSR